MSDEFEVLDFERSPQAAGLFGGRAPKEKLKEQEGTDEESCTAFGFLRGIRDRALAVELRMRNGNAEWFAYSCLTQFQHNPSVGLLLRLTGDVTTLVLIRGSNLDALVNGGSINLTDRGLQRHRVTYVREMEEEELRKAKQGEPTVDRIEVAEFESQEELREWLQKTAPAFVRKMP